MGKAGVIPADNAQIAIPDRQFVMNESKARQLGDGLDRVSDPYVRMSPELPVAFGLRREESIKFLSTLALFEVPPITHFEVRSCSRSRTL